jgi:1-acyl-sn-glycerol-3-phosphate acyltransferase
MTFCYAIGYCVVKTAANLLFGLRIINREKAQVQGPVIFAMNHQSNVDPPLIGLATDREVHWLAKRSLLEIPVLGPILKQINVIPVSLDKPDMSGLKSIISLLKQGEAVAIFPEGQRAFDGRLQAALPGLGMAILKTGAPVVPMRIFGADAVMRRGTKRINLRPITIVVGDALHIRAEDFPGKPREVYQAVSDRIMEAIAALELPPEEEARLALREHTI